MIIDTPADLEGGHKGPANRFDKDAVKAAAAGKWIEIIAHTANISVELLDGGHHPCPKCGGDDRFRFIDEDEGACFCNVCFRERNGDGFAAIQWLTGWSFPDTVAHVARLLHIDPATDSGGTKSSSPPPAPDLLATTSKPPKKAKHVIDDATADFRDQIYSELGEQFGLSDAHREQLRKRGLSDQEIDHRGYWSFEPDTIKMLKFAMDREAIREKIVRQVPGVFPGDITSLGAFRSALVIPVRDTRGRCVALKMRVDKPAKGKRYLWFSSAHKDGPSPGTPSHVPLPPVGGFTADPAAVSRITEGPLKADIATALSGIQTFGIGGVSAWKPAVPIIESVGPKILRVAMDRDAERNQGVADCVCKVWDRFTTIESKTQIHVETWEADGSGNPKGIDDALSAKAKIDVLALVDAKNFVDRLRAVANPGSALEDLRELECPHDPSRIARLNLKRYRERNSGDLRYWQGRWWRYKAGHWRELSDEELDAKIRYGIEEELLAIAKAQEPDDSGIRKPKKPCTNALVSNVGKAMRSQQLLSSSIEMPCWLPEPAARRQLLSVRNGLLDIDAVLAGNPPKDSLYEHSPYWFSGVQLDYEFDPAGSCPFWENYLLTSVPDEASRLLLQEWAGYLLTSSNPFQKFLALEGEGGTGKSVFAAGMTAMLGEKSVSNADLEQFGTQFGLGKTMGKALNIDSDVHRGAKFSEGAFKKFAVGERMDFQIKGGDPFSQRPTAKVLLCWNQRPRIRDESSGFWRRMLLIPFTEKVASSSRILNADQSWWWLNTGEMPGVLNWAIEGVQRLFRQGRFTEPAAMNDLIRGYRNEMNPVEAFIEEVVGYDPERSNKVRTSSIVASFRHWCTDNASDRDAEQMNPKRMGWAIKKKFGIEAVTISGTTTENKSRGFQGVFLKDTEGNKNSCDDDEGKLF